MLNEASFHYRQLHQLLLFNSIEGNLQQATKLEFMAAAPGGVFTNRFVYILLKSFADSQFPDKPETLC